MWMDAFRRRTARNAHANARQYAAPADPWRLVPVDPAAVDRFRTVSLLWGLGRVRGGDWDLPDNCRPYADLNDAMAQGLRERFVEGLPWADTTYYEGAAERITEEGSYRNCESVDELEAQLLPALDDLYEDMRDNGYRPNRGVVYTDPEDVEYIHDLEPLVLFDRQGDPIWTEGYHRLVIARILGIEMIPVCVLRRHAAWQRVRDRVAETRRVPEDVPADAGHPDLQDILC